MPGGGSNRSGDGEPELVAAARDGSERAVEALVRRHWPVAHRTAYLIVGDAAGAEDVAQESLLAAIESLERFDASRPFGPWLHRIVANNALKWLRRASHRHEASVGEPPERTARPHEPELSSELVRALSRLDAEQRAAVVLRHLLDFTPGEIAEALELPRGTVNSRLRRALDRLAADLGEEYS